MSSSYQPTSRILHNNCVALFFDLSKAFDTLAHNKVIRLLEQNVFKGQFIQWFKNNINQKGFNVKITVKKRNAGNTINLMQDTKWCHNLMLTKWCHNMGLRINPSKTKIMHSNQDMYPKVTHHNNECIHIDYRNINQSLNDTYTTQVEFGDEYKYHNLKWNNIFKMCKSV